MEPGRTPSEITCRRATVAEIMPLRHRILRAGLPFETMSERQTTASSPWNAA